MSTEKKEKPSFIFRDGMTSDKEYVEWLAELKSRYKQSQVKAAVRVNSTLLEYYWSLGRDIVRQEAESRWGSGFFNQLSLDMKAMFPNETGFSVTNLKYMKRWYVFYTEDVTIRQRVVDEIEMPSQFGLIPWGQHIDIFTRCESKKRALFYIEKSIENGWSRPQLNSQIDNNLFERQGAAITNFDTTLPESQSQLAKELLKNEYNLDFITAKSVQAEKDLEEALAQNVTRFLLELGKGFAYLGRQRELRMDDESVFFPDLLFYHIPQRRYVIVELKTVKFAPEFAGKLNFYVTAADNLLRGKDDNPSVGLLICKTAKKTIVEWSLKDINKPLGIATYQLQEVVERTIAEIEEANKKK
jgi:predicted nuclease of restriction endonuclease-like (RecB) superfamily